MQHTAVGQFVIGKNDTIYFPSGFTVKKFYPYDNSIVTFMASVDGELGIGVEIDIDGQTLVTDENGKAELRLKNGIYTYVSRFGDIVNDSVSLRLEQDAFVKVKFTSLGVNTVNNKQFNIFPNPSNENFVIAFGTNSSTHEVKIYNVQGELIYQNKACQSAVPISIGYKGLFIVEVKDESGVNRKRL